TGCYAELDRDALARIAGIDEIIGHSDRERIPAVLDRSAPGAAPAEAREIACIEEATSPAAGSTGPLHFGDRSRAFLKIQEGCDLSCSYCIIPKVRGASRSIAPGRLESAGGARN